MVALDINNAYNCVSIDTLVNLLFDRNFPAIYVNWIHEFLSKRILKLGDDEVIVRDGLPQGSCLSPLLFNLYTGSLHFMEDSNTLIYQFADDFLILTFHKEFDDAVKIMQYKCNLFMRKCAELNLSFNLDKTKTMYIAKGSRKEVNITLNNTKIEQVKDLKFLGRVLNTSSTAGDHYSRSLDNARSSTNLIKALTTVKGGLQPRISLNFFKSFVRSKVEYARTTMAHTPASINRRISTFQNSSLRRCLGLTRSTPVHVIYALSGEMPVNYRAKFLTAKEIIDQKFYNYPNYRCLEDSVPVKASYSYVFNDFADIFRKVNTDCVFIKCPKLKIIMNTLPSRKSDMSMEQIRAVYNEKISYFKSNGFDIFATDSSLSVSSTGCAVYHLNRDENFCYKITYKSSSFFGELFAVRKAVEIARSMGVSKLVIFTDSRVSCQVLNSGMTENFQVALIHNILNDSSIEECILVWTPSHCGVGINEKVDTLAKRATSDGIEVDVDYNREEAIRLVRERLFHEWNSEFIEISRQKGRFFASIFPNVPRNPWFMSNNNLDPGEVKSINRLMSGHTFGKMYLYKIGVLESILCDTCNVDDDSNHTIFACKKYDDLRRRYNFFMNYSNIFSLLKSGDFGVYKSLCDFMRNAKINL